MSRAPALLASNKGFYWTTPDEPSLDYFDFKVEGAASLLLLATHLSDERPWDAARNPVWLTGEAGWIDLACKRILGKRYRLKTEDTSLSELRFLDPIPVLLQKMRNKTHDFFDPKILWPEAVKLPGRLVPRQLVAEIKVSFAGETLAVYARNFSEVSQCLHAEIGAIMALSEALSIHPSPPSRLDTFELSTTLKPCRMCAAFLKQVKTRCRDFEVRYKQNDPGPLAHDTWLDREGYSHRS